MESQWLHRMGHSSLIIFCNGWGMDERPFRPLASLTYDVLMLYDYRRIPAIPDIPKLLQRYQEVSLVSWSMGVWIGQNLFTSCSERFRMKVAINGTLCPIHDELGIPVDILTGTARNFSEASRQKLYTRMCRDRECCAVFQNNLPGRSLESQRQELEVLLEMGDCQQGKESIYSHIMIADRDCIMPTANQIAFWKESAPCIFHAQHFPFYLWPTWDALLTEVLHMASAANTV